LEREMIERREAEAKVAQLNHELCRRIEELETIIELSPVGIAITSGRDTRVIRGNAALSAMMGTERGGEAFCGSPAYRFRRDGREIAQDELPLHRAITDGLVQENVEFDVIRPDGEVRTLLSNVAPLFDEG